MSHFPSPSRGRSLLFALLLIGSLFFSSPGFYQAKNIYQNYQNRNGQVLGDVDNSPSSHYVDAATGSDTNNGFTLATAFKTIQKCASVAGGRNERNTCLIKGGTYRETVRPANSGVTFRNFNGENVTVSGAEIIPNGSFAQHSGNIYKAPMNWSLNIRHNYSQSTNNQIFVNGKMMVEARWPNIPVENVTNITNIQGKRQDNARADGSQIFSNTSAKYLDVDLSGAGAFWGQGTNKGKINFNPGYSIMSLTCDVSGKDAGSVSWQCNPDPGQGNAARTFDTSNNTQHGPKANNYYYLWGKLEALDTGGEWFRDPPDNNLGTMVDENGSRYANQNGTLYLQMPDNSNPATSSQLVEARKRMYAFDLSARNNITIDGIKIFAATVKTNDTSNSHTLQNMEARYLWHTQELPPLFYTGGTNGLEMQGSNNTIRNSLLAYASGNMVSFSPAFQKTNSGNKLINNVIQDLGYGGFSTGIVGASSDGGNRHKIEQNSIFNSGRYQVQMEKNSDVKYNDLYNSHLQITDLGAIYGWGADGNGAEIAYNLVHDIWAQKANDNQFGAHGIYADDETTGFKIYRNIVWNTTSNGMMLAGYRPWITQHSNQGRTSNNRQVYNNTIVGTLGLLNKCNSANLSQCGFQTGTEFKNNIAIAQSQQPALDSKHGTIDWGVNLWTSALFVNKDNLDYNLREGSPALDTGNTLSPYTDGASGSPDLGALEKILSSRTNFVSGALILEQDLANLQLSCGQVSSNKQCQITGLPVGRKLPMDFKLKVGTITFNLGENCQNKTDYQTNQTSGSCENLDLLGQTGLLPISVQIGTGAEVSKGTANFDGLQITNVTPNALSATASTPLSIFGFGFDTSSFSSNYYSRQIPIANSSGQKLYDYQVPVVLDTQSLIAAGKMRSDCGDIRFSDGYETLSYWLEEGCNTPQTRLWVKVSYIPDNNNSSIKLTYGQPDLTSASSGKNTFVWFDDFSAPTLSNAFNYNPNPASGITVGLSDGQMKVAGATTSTNQSGIFGFSLYWGNLGALPSNFALDSELSALSGTNNFKSSVGGFDNTATLTGSPSGTPLGKNIAYYSGGFQTVGKSTINSATFQNKKFSLGFTGPTTARNLKWMENGNLATAQATRSGLNNPTIGYFNYGPNATANFEARFDNLRIRQFSASAIDPLVGQASEEVQTQTLKIDVSGQPCQQIKVLSSTQASCLANAQEISPIGSGYPTLTLVNPDQAQATYNLNSSPTLPTVILNEANFGGSIASSSDYWLELYNATDAPIDLNNWTVENLGNLANPNITLNSSVCSNLQIPARGYFLLSKFNQNNAQTNLNVQEDCLISDLELTGGETLKLKNPNAEIVDELA